MKSFNKLLVSFVFFFFGVGSIYAQSQCQSGVAPKVLFKEDFTFVIETSQAPDCKAKPFTYFRNIETSYKVLPGDCNYNNVDDNMCLVVSTSEVLRNFTKKNCFGATGNEKSWEEKDGYLTRKYSQHDGYLFINCDKDPGKIFGVTVDGLCKNTTCHFSIKYCSLNDTDENNCPGRVKFVVKGKQTGEIIGEEEVDIPKGTPGAAKRQWRSHSMEIETNDQNSVYIFELYNAIDEATAAKYPKGEGSPGINGNDIAIDDIMFTACVPYINLYSDGELTKKDIKLDCQTSTDLYINTSEIASQFPNGIAYFILQESTNKSTWKNVLVNGKEVNKGIDKFPINISESDTGGRYFRLWAGVSEDAVKKAASQGQGTDCSQLTAVSDLITVTYKCDCDKSQTPNANPYSKCPSNTQLDLSSLIENKEFTGEYKWYDSKTATTPMSSTKVNVNTEGTHTYYLTYTKPKYSAQPVCESDRKPVVVTVNGPIQFDVTPKDITTCLHKGANLTYTAKATSPSGVTFKWQDQSKKQLGTGATYTLPATPGTGTITVVASDPSGKACDAEKDVTYNLTPVNSIDKPVASRPLVCVGDPKSKITANIISGTGKYVIRKNGNQVWSGTATSGKIEYEDNKVSDKEEVVTYEIEFGEGDCKDVKSTTVTVGKETTLTIESNAPENKVCVDREFSLTVTDNCPTKSGESVKWFKDGVAVPGTTCTLAGQKITANTTYTVETVGTSCPGSGSITMVAEKPIKAVIKSSAPAVCENNPVDLMDTNTEKASQYQWQKSEDGGATWQDMAGETGRKIENYIPKKTASYRLATKNGASLCPEFSDPITVTVTPPPSIESITEHTICISNPSVKITAKISSDAVPYEWFKDGASVDSGTTTAGQTEIVLEDDAVAGSAVTVTYKLVLGITGCSDEKETTVKVTDRVKIRIKSDVSNDRICADGLFNLTAFYQLVGSEWLKWEKAGEVLAEKGTKLTGETINESSVLYKVTLMDGQCDGDGEITMYADSPVNPQISTKETNICKGTKINITNSDVSKATKYQWQKSEDGGVTWQDMAGQTGKDIKGYAPDETATYRLTVENGKCNGVSNEVKVTVNPQIEFKVSADQSICYGGKAELVMSGYPATATVGWYIDGDDDNPISESNTVVVKPAQTTKYKAMVVDVCTASKNSTVNVEPAIEYTITPDGDICVGESRQLEVTGGKYYSWSPASSLDDATSATPKATPRETTTYEVTISTDLCSTNAKTTVNVHPLPIIESIENMEQGEVVVTVKSGTEPYYYSTNGKDFVESNIFTGLTIGTHMMYVKDNATCKTEQLFEVPPVPVIPDVFFSPNDDGVHDMWTVKNLNYYSEYRVEIFDRYGKRLYVFNKGGFSDEKRADDFKGWDGIYNGHEMPSDDYWYIITVEEIRKQFTGHFILKR